MELIKRSNQESAQRFFELFLYYIKLCFRCALAMSFLRFLIFWSTLEPDSSETGLEIAATFWMGLRFDVLVLGFVGIPLTTAGITFGIAHRWPKADFQGLQRYIFGFWCLFGFISFFDLDFFLYRFKHMQWQDHLAFDYFQTLANSFQSLSSETLLMSLVIWLCVILITGRAILSVQKHPVWVIGQKLPWLLKWLLPVLVIALMARGTLTAHHLEFQHSELSPSAKLNEIALNAAWTLDKSYQR